VWRVCESVVTKLELGVLEYWLTKHRLVSVHGTMKQATECQLHILSLLPDSDVSGYLQIVRQLVQVVSDFKNSLSGTHCGHVAITWSLNIPPHLNCVATLPREIYIFRNHHSQK